MIIGLDHYKNTYNVQSETIIQPGLANMERAMGLLDEPQKAYKSIHLAGTNGKGSTLTYLKEIALAHGLSVGTFMSPGIIDLHDQIQVDGVPISEQELGRVFEQMAVAGLSGVCTDFELLTCAAFVHFRNVKVDVAIVEAGMGGRFDSTNVMDAQIAVIPSIALEHTNFLGETLEEIAWHKAGIIKQGASAFVGKVSPDVLAVFKREASVKGAELQLATVDFDVKQTFGNEIKAGKMTFSPVQLKMLGEHQLDNAALAVASFVQFAEKLGVVVEETKVLQALSVAQLPFRFEEILPNVILDGAHNPASVEKLVQFLQQYFQRNKITIVLGMLADKDVKEVLTMLEQVSDRFYFMEIGNPRAMPATDIFKLSQAEEKQVVSDIVEVISAPRPTEEIVVITGSLYLLSDLRQALLTMQK